MPLGVEHDALVAMRASECNTCLHQSPPSARSAARGYHVEALDFGRARIDRPYEHASNHCAGRASDKQGAVRVTPFELAKLGVEIGNTQIRIEAFFVFRQQSAKRR